jgi:hypothetical protein
VKTTGQRGVNGPRQFLLQYPDGNAPGGTLIWCGRCETRKPPESFYALSGSMERLVAEIDKCEVVCAICHRIRTKARGPVTRGRDGRKPSFPVGSTRL